MKKSKDLFSPAMLLLLGFVGVLGIVFIQRVRNTGSTRSNAVRPTPAIVDTTRQQETAWVEYRNQAYGFAVDHPADWQVIDSQQLLDTNEAVFFGFSPVEIPETTLARVTVHDKATTSVDDIIADSSKRFSEIQQNQSDIMVKGQPARKIMLTTPEDPDWINQMIVFENDSYYFTMSTGGIRDEARAQNLVRRTGQDFDFTFENFYSSFQFLE